jgi:hypothetical protein
MAAIIILMAYSSKITYEFSIAKSFMLFNLDHDWRADTSQAAQNRATGAQVSHVRHGGPDGRAALSVLRSE